MNEKSIKLIAENVAAKINKINRFGTQITGYHVIEKATYEEIMFFYERMCLSDV